MCNVYIVIDKSPEVIKDRYLRSYGKKCIDLKTLTGFVFGMILKVTYLGLWKMGADVLPLVE